MRIICLVFLFCVNFTDGDETWTDPYDLFADYKKSPYITEDKDGDKTYQDNSLDCKNSLQSCNGLVLDIVSLIYNQLPATLDSNEYSINLHLILTSEKAEYIKTYYTYLEEDKLHLCDILKSSLQRSSEHLAVRFLKNIFFGILNLIKTILQYSVHITKIIINFKDFIVLQIIVIFLSSVFILLKFRSMRIVSVWIIMCFGFLSIYTTYVSKLQEAVREQEALYIYSSGSMPKECLDRVKSTWHLFTEYFTGPTPVELSPSCKKIYINQNIDPEIKIKLTDVLSDVIVSAFTTIINKVDVLSLQISERYPLFVKPVVAGLVYIICCIFIILFLAISMNKDVKLFFIKIYQRNSASNSNIVHRIVVEPVQPGPSVHAVQQTILPPVDWLHDYLEKGIERQRIRDSSSTANNEHAGSINSNLKSIRQRTHVYNRVKSVQTLLPNNLSSRGKRRMSF